MEQRFDVSTQKLSKLELYVLILEILEQNHSLTLLDIEAKTGIKSTILKTAMPFLEQQRFVRPTKQKDDVQFENTSKALGVLRYFGRQSELANNDMVF
jgi:predicted transcriptional regulator